MASDDVAQLDAEPDTADELAVELAACAADVAYWTHHYLTIDDAQGGGDGTTPFKLWPAQVGVLWQMMTCLRIIILKARQLGISWLSCAFVLHHVLFSPGKVALLYSQGQAEAAELLRRVKVLYERLPEWMRDALPKPTGIDTQTEWRLSNGSRVMSFATTEKAGRGLTASLIVCDEAAHIGLLSKLYAAFKPCIDGGGRLIILSTANGPKWAFHRLWMKASAKSNDFVAIFLPWWSRPGRNQAWYDRQVAEAEDPALIPQEYPATAQEAFVSSGRVRFAGVWVSAQAANVRDGIPRAEYSPALAEIDAKSGGKLAVFSAPFRLPLKPRKSLASADVAEGLASGDASCVVVFDKATCEELASLHGKWEPDLFGELVAMLADAYECKYVIERNNHGHAAIAAARRKSPSRCALGHDGKPGWITNAQTKPVGVDAVAARLRDGGIVVRSRATLDEMRIYEVGDNGSTNAPSGDHDDRVMQWAVGLGWLKLCNHQEFRVIQS